MQKRQKHTHDNKDLYPFQVDELHANVIPSPRKNSGVKMQLTFSSLPRNSSKKKKKTEVSKLLQFASVLQWAMRCENLTDSSEQGSRGTPHETPLVRHCRGAHRWPWSSGSQLSLIPLFALKAVPILFFPINREDWGSQGLIVCRNTSCRKQSPICC